MLPKCLAEPFCLDMKFPFRGNEPIVLIGDVHACYFELEELKFNITQKYGPSTFLFLGDLCDRGPENIQTIKSVLLDPFSYCLIGNHDRKLIRYCAGGNIPDHVEQQWFASITDVQKKEILSMYENCPTAMRVMLPNGITLTASHGGAPPILYTELWNSFPWRLKGKEAAICYFGHTTGNRTEDGYPERLHKPVLYENVISVYGHMVHHPEKENWFIKDEPGTSVYLDHGGVFGGWLSAMIIFSDGSIHFDSIRCPEYKKGKNDDFSSSI